MKPLRDVEIEWEIDNSKCEECENKPCLYVCPIDSIHLDDDEIINIDENCFGCVLCREACPFDAIKMETKMGEPIMEQMPIINPKLCRSCGACVSKCKTGAIHLSSSGGEEVHSEIDEDKCVRCGYCFRSCPTDAIRYGKNLPRTVQADRSIFVNPNKCVGCMACMNVCPSQGAIAVSKTSGMPYIDPFYCSRCEICMEECAVSAIEYSSSKKAYETFKIIKSVE